MRRRDWLRGALGGVAGRSSVGALAATLAACAAPGTAPGERIVELRSGRSLGRDELLAAMLRADIVLLGEQHDNPLHHQRRGELLAALAGAGGAGVTVVAEHLTRGQRVRFDAGLEAGLAAAGFDARAWGWPLHRPLFAAVARAGLPLSGGNLPRDLARTIARQGEAAVPADLAALLAAAPLDEAARTALDADLQRGHCGQLPAARLPAMRAAQRARDAAMAQALLDSGGRPAVLLAGNGHVRRDYGVAQLIGALRPQARWLSVGFVDGDGPPPDAASDASCTHLWWTAAPARDDACAGFSLPAAAPASGASRPSEAAR